MLPSDLSPLELSLEIAGCATFATAVLATACARGFLTLKKRLRMFLEVFFLCPLVLPPTVVGYALMAFLGRSGPFSWFIDGGLLFTRFASVTASVVVSFPLMYLSARASFRSIDTNLLDAARSFGSKPFHTLRTIQIPLAAQGLLAGVLLTFGRSLGEFGATLMVSGNIPGQTQTLPIALFFDVEAGDYPRALVWTSFALVSSGLIIWIINLISESEAFKR